VSLGALPLTWISELPIVPDEPETAGVFGYSPPTIVVFIVVGVVAIDSACCAIARATESTCAVGERKRRYRERHDPGHARFLYRRTATRTSTRENQGSAIGGI
jgi:hypothetical protein